MNALQAHDRKFAIMNWLLKTKAVKLFKDDNECCFLHGSSCNTVLYPQRCPNETTFLMKYSTLLI